MIQQQLLAGSGYMHMLDSGMSTCAPTGHTLYMMPQGPSQQALVLAFDVVCCLMLAIHMS